MRAFANHASFTCRFDFTNGGQRGDALVPSVKRARGEQSRNVCVRLINPPQRVRNLTTLRISELRALSGRWAVAPLNPTIPLVRERKRTCDARWRFWRGDIGMFIAQANIRVRQSRWKLAWLAKARVVGSTPNSCSILGPRIGLPGNSMLVTFVLLSALELRRIGVTAHWNYGALESRRIGITATRGIRCGYERDPASTIGSGGERS